MRILRSHMFASTVLVIALAAAPVLADDDDDDDRKSVGKPLQKIEKAIERLENFQLPEVESTREHPSSFFVGPKGEVRVISGEITALASTTMSVKVWGLTFAVNTGRAQFTPQGAQANLRVGDKVNIKGSIAAATGSINATLVHALSSRNRMVDELVNLINRLIEQLRELQRRAGLPVTPLPTPPPADTTAPTISSVTADNLTATSARIRWTTNEAADSVVWYSTVTPVVTASPTPSVSSVALVTSHELTLTGLTASTTYRYIVKSKDAVGNTAASSEASFVTP
ncbi:MAG: fibronectin type III domain-containing protein [Candidatus Sungbacteria bacterium]|uniref:Fibronectin type III domain-containing protein n=1 Tax=Candidatus Sungiibacteriota bacterium TaxID=2750080 RepID=A0A932YZ22_9BACT|nr:fibronectin type III domain-containing protein [Candidatus Sungbacteria bacterium]